RKTADPRLAAQCKLVLAYIEVPVSTDVETELRFGNEGSGCLVHVPRVPSIDIVWYAGIAKASLLEIVVDDNRQFIRKRKTQLDKSAHQERVIWLHDDDMSAADAEHLEQ